MTQISPPQATCYSLVHVYGHRCVRRDGKEFTLTVHVPSNAVHGDGSVSVQEAAAAFGRSEKTIRRRIKAGTLAAHRVPTSQGYEWRVHLNGVGERASDSVVPNACPVAVQVHDHEDRVPGTPAEPKSDQAPLASRLVDQEPGPHIGHLDGRAAHLPGYDDQAPSQPEHTVDQETGHIAASPDRALLKALDLTDRLQRENMELAGRVGFLQAKLQTAEEQLLALAAPTPPQPATDEPSSDPDQPWWKRLFGLA